jgi:hypothetical protein
MVNLPRKHMGIFKVLGKVKTSTIAEQKEKRETP